MDITVTEELFAAVEVKWLNFLILKESLRKARRLVFEMEERLLKEWWYYLSICDKNLYEQSVIF